MKLLALLLVALAVSKAESLIQRANILFLMCDSMDGRVLDPTSPVSQRLEMPNLRRLASRGTNFVNTYCAAPQCVPSRTTMFAGRHTHNIKAWSNSQGLAALPSGAADQGCIDAFNQKQCDSWGDTQDNRGTLVDSLQAARCEVCLYGKVDVGGGVIEAAGQGNATVLGFHGGPTLSITGRSANIRRPTKPDPSKITNDMDNHVHQEDWKKVDQCIEWLESRNSTADNADSSWMLYCSVNIPHPSFQTNATWLGYVHEDKIDVPTWPKREDFHPADAYQSKSKNVWRDFTDKEILTVRKTYYAMCAETDFLMGRVLDAANRTGNLDDTYVIFLSDHGEMNMEHRQVWKNSMYEASARVPLIIAGPGVSAGVVNTNLTSLLDVFPTLVDMVGGVNPTYLDGHSLAPLLVETEARPAMVDMNQGLHPASFHLRRAASLARVGIETKAHRVRPDFVVSQYHSNMGNTGSFMVRWGQWKYIAFGTTLSAFAHYQPQLFNVASDPEELNDVATTAMGRPIVKILDEKLRSVVDYPSVDHEVKVNDAAIYKQWFIDIQTNTTGKTLRKKWEEVFQGFNDTDWAAVQSWQKEIMSLAPLHL